MFPDHFEDAPPPADGILGRNVEYSTLNRDEFPDLTRVYTYYERPNPLNETGCFKVEVDGKLVQKGKWPFPFTHRLNIAVMRESLIENEAYGSTIWSDVRSLQVAYNAAWSGFLENMRETALNRLLVDHEWEDQLETLSDRSGSVLVGDMTRPRPEYLKAPQTPRPLIQGIEMLRAEVDDILGVHKVAKGDAPANIESGLGIQLLIEQNDTPVGRLLDEGARAWSDVCSMVLQILEKEVTEKRTTVCRDGSGPVRREWTGKTIHGQTDVYISRESLTPKSRAAQQALAQNALQMGILGPPDDPMTVVRFVRFAEMPDARGLIASMNRDADRAIRENESVVMGEVPLPKMIDDHDIHIEIHEDFQKTLEFDQLSPEQQADHEAHLQAHRTMKAEALGETRMAQSIDPALGGVAPGPTPEPVPAPAPAPAPEPISPDQAAADMMQAIQNL